MTWEMGNCHLFCIVPPLEKQFGNCVTIRALSVSAICVHSFITLRNSNDKSRSNWSSHYGARKPFQTCVNLFVLSRIQVQRAILHNVDRQVCTVFNKTVPKFNILRGLLIFAICVPSFITLQNSNDKSRITCEFKHKRTVVPFQITYQFSK